MRMSEKRFRDITSSLGAGLYVTETSGKVSFINPEAERLLGWTAREVLGKALHVLIHPADQHGGRLPLEECPIINVVKTGIPFFSRREMFVRKDGAALPVSVISAPLLEAGKIVAAVTSFQDISALLKAEQEREALIVKLQEALAAIKTLHGVLPICSFCKKIRDDKGSWLQLEAYIHDHTEAQFSHGMCEECAKARYPQFSERFKKGKTDPAD